MAHPKLVLLVKFKPGLPLDEVMAVANERADEFRALTGLTQKYYLHDAATGEIAGLYLWESPEAFDAYRQSELRASIASAYKAQGEPRVEVYDVLMPLRDSAA
jgi:heme-degrading monooxygenase HmoA